MAIDLQQAMGHDLRTEYHNKSGREAFMGMAHYPAYVQWLELELRAARQNIKVDEQTPTNSDYAECADDILKLDCADEVINKHGYLVDILKRHFA